MSATSEAPSCIGILSRLLFACLIAAVVLWGFVIWPIEYVATMDQSEAICKTGIAKRVTRLKIRHGFYAYVTCRDGSRHTVNG